MKHARDSSTLSLSPPRQRGSATRYNVGDESSCELAGDANKRQAVEVSAPQQHRRASMPAVTAKAPEPACAAEPPRRRYQRRCSATMYNLHNYAQQVQEQQGEINR
mmetsp:Transcript_29220/g.48276  ORF Transcript_29220/g.48276 Transcript_29220/m.48276 type:complete len:106 (-) Transcript_29220:186-503(-)|eukprot:CAMPEP_0119020270 /NCGR_PEP_ID=MMETSP1176-20130426/23690_1 /TAXON_ID=265551 /ORGANISM="Synedropsis recta cf, Strain CCMP1620" /LENGTH=105 /DNA_ID=CAMNT_0006974669 /DNA_START=93 /DNA_END=410 /DNA_ORIENTATION=-